ncbi:hypothetical protein HCN51_52110 [Nonomuraea sp. FMUSA5-5]|uniref:DUF3558 domain-containing protein n=1 Tax=Nonomuraea composti TaxID=2720023 RepID=A0ABX1BRQ4_9ACTN|nr:hypothetical protein [Nonomuraea sp. FMUSA5-5]NJP97878.1 hypothetical protein [Nonomuraea sp. FMUSA5-5]
MRRLAAVLLMLTLTGCGGAGGDGGEVQGSSTTPPSPSPSSSPSHEPAGAGSDSISLSCDGTDVRVPASPAGLTPAGAFGRLDSLTRPLKVEGRIWSDNDERMYVGVVCGVRTAEQFATLVARSTLTAYKGKPALRWTTRTGVRSFMWLERPGTAVYVGATPGLADDIRPIAADITT